ncbi:hypothetical protein J7E50_02580 [Pedobacter sp. ISL-68]|uniref:hypothetical protein n=1 Tax=unclassified Pedobacter TaxID=2628915 RepID=UPI001BEC2FF8|nr:MULTISPECIES: hypothetical protein [unclassified Pedobacter]MBT2560107.1 hypothetical protein [Pedobacter sp. ISL-64]MBT2589086.1 hypothetical protein [Pedobacter sp. ISL-68]
MAKADIERKIEDLFGDEPFKPVEEELFKWLIFAYFDRGKGISDLDLSGFECFKVKLMTMVEDVYQLSQLNSADK